MNIDPAALAGIAAIASAAVQMLKVLPVVKDRPGWHPLLAVAAATLIAVAWLGTGGVSLGDGHPLAWIVLHGVASGLAAAGLYSHVRAAASAATGAKK